MSYTSNVGSIATMEEKDHKNKKAVKKVDSSDIASYLSDLKGVMIKQEIEAIEIVTRFETQNKYAIKTLKGQDIFYAFEDSSFILRNCFGAKRNLKIKIYNFDKTEVMRLQRPWRCQCCLFFCCLQKLKVFSPINNLIGSIRQNWNMLMPELSVYDNQDEMIYIIKGPIFLCKMCGNVEFKILSADDHESIGTITRLWKGPLTEFLANKIIDADTYEVLFPDDADPIEKGLLIGATLLIDFMYFEKSAKKKKVRRRKK